MVIVYYHGATVQTPRIIMSLHNIMISWCGSVRPTHDRMDHDPIDNRAWQGQSFVTAFFASGSIDEVLGLPDPWCFPVFAFPRLDFGSMLVQRLRRWPNIELMSSEFVVFGTSCLLTVVAHTSCGMHTLLMAGNKPLLSLSRVWSRLIWIIQIGMYEGQVTLREPGCCHTCTL